MFLVLECLSRKKDLDINEAQPACSFLLKEEVSVLFGYMNILSFKSGRIVIKIMEYNRTPMNFPNTKTQLK